LDFYSWHIYGLINPYGLKQLGTEIRSVLDTNGFTNTQSHISEYNVELDPSITAFINSAQGAAYYLSLMLTAQEAGIDKMLIYPSGSLVKTSFTATTYTMTESANAMKAFDILKDSTTIIVQSTGNEVIDNDIDDASSNFMVFAAKDSLDSKLNVLISNLASIHSDYQINVSNLPWINTYPTKITKNIITTTDNFTQTISYMGIGDSVYTVDDVGNPSVTFLRMEPSQQTVETNETTQNPIYIYPNPTSDLIRLPAIYNWKLLSIEGSHVASGHGDKIDLSTYPAGIYILRLGNKTKKIYLTQD
jgi:hypothetical protein